MKKLFFILMVALALPMMGQNKADATKTVRHTTNHSAKASFVTKHVIYEGVRADVPEGYAQITLAVGDVWSDGSGYQMLLDADHNTFGSVIPETGPLTTSGNASAAVYAEFEYKIPENADGSLTTSNIVINDEVTILIPAGIYDFCITNPTPGDRMWIAASQGSLGGRGDDYAFNSQASYYITVVLDEVSGNDWTDVLIDDPNAPVLPENVTADPAATTADVAWDNDHDPLFNLRYRVYNPNAEQHLFWGVDDLMLDDWMVLDNDGDGGAWELYDLGDGNYCFTSASYDYNYGGALSPDNWLFTPVVPFGGTLSFWAANYSSYYADHFDIYIAVGDGENLDDFVLLEAGIEPSTDGDNYIIDLAAYAGQEGRIAFRHTDCYDKWRLFLDDVAIDVPGEPLNEWIVVEGIEGTDYTIEGLDPETTYEVQVQAVGVDGRTSDWTQSVLFTTEEAGTAPTEQCLAPNSGYEITGVEVATVTITNREEGATVNYEVYCDGVLVDSGSFTGESYSFNVTGAGSYVIHAIATLPTKLDSPDGGVFFTIMENEGPTGISELNGGKTVAGVRYFNALGQEMQDANGMTIVVTTYTDGTTSTAKVVK